MFACSDCRRFRVGDRNHQRILQLIDEEDYGGVFRFSSNETGWGMCNSKHFDVPATATVASIACDLMDSVYDHLTCAAVRVELHFRNDEVATAFQGPPVSASTESLESAIRSMFLQHAVHPRLVRVTAKVLCMQSYNVVSKLQKNAVSGEHILLSGVQVSQEAKDLAAQIKCWFAVRSIRGECILAKHFLAGLLVAHLFEDLQTLLHHYPAYCEDYRWSFSNDIPGLQNDRLAYCRSSVFMLQNPELLMISDSHPEGHWHRLRCGIADAGDVALDVSVKPELLPLNLSIRMQLPQVLVDGKWQKALAHCPTIAKFKTSVNFMILAALARLVGKFQKVRSLYWKRIHDKYAPGSAIFKELSQKYVNVKPRKFRFLRYLGLNDVMRAKKARRRRLRQRFLVCHCVK